MENVSAECVGSVGPAAGGSVWMETPLGDLACVEGGEVRRLSLLTVLGRVCGVLLKVSTGELEGAAVVAGVQLVEGKKCFGRAKLKVWDDGAFPGLLDIVTAGGAEEFETLPWKGNSLGEEGDEFCNCCCSSKTWL